MPNKYFKPDEYDNFLIDNNLVSFSDKPTRGKSRRLLYHYFNFREIIRYQGLKERLVRYIFNFYRDSNVLDDQVNYFYGVPEGARDIGIKLTEYYNNIYYHNELDTRHIVIGRGKIKKHGKPENRYFLAPPKKGDFAVVVEDVTTTGSSLINSIDNLIKADVKVIGAISLANRLEIRGRNDKRTVEQYIKDVYKINFLYATDLIRLFPKAANKLKPSEETLEKVLNYCKRYTQKEVYDQLKSIT